MILVKFSLSTGFEGEDTVKVLELPDAIADEALDNIGDELALAHSVAKGNSGDDLSDATYTYEEILITKAQAIKQFGAVETY